MYRMDRPQLIRRLRIAASVFFAVVTVAMCVLWVRAHWKVDSVYGPIINATHLVFTSRHGGIGIGVGKLIEEPGFHWLQFEAHDFPPRESNLGLLGFEVLWPTPKKTVLYGIRAPFGI